MCGHLWIQFMWTSVMQIKHIWSHEDKFRCTPCWFFVISRTRCLLRFYEVKDENFRMSERVVSVWKRIFFTTPSLSLTAYTRCIYRALVFCTRYPLVRCERSFIFFINVAIFPTLFTGSSILWASTCTRESRNERISFFLVFICPASYSARIQ